MKSPVFEQYMRVKVSLFRVLFSHWLKLSKYAVHQETPTTLYSVDWDPTAVI